MSNDVPAPSPDGFPAGQASAMQDVLLGTSKHGHGWQPPEVEDLQALLPQYLIQRMLGRGGMGAVYQGRQANLDRQVAIKILPSSMEKTETSSSSRFKNEARAMARLSHPGIVTVYDFGETSCGLLFIVMEYVEGTDVQKLITANHRLHTEHAMVITTHVCDALQYAHEKGIIHRDIKPSNIMVRSDGAVKVTDFGLAKLHEGGESQHLTQSGGTLGTPHYMAPEVLTPNMTVDLRADIYALGVMLYHMLTGKLPQGLFELPSMQVPGLDPRYDGIIAKALREDRDLRYPKASDMRADLDRIMTQPVIKAGARERVYTSPLKINESLGSLAGRSKTTHIPEKGTGSRRLKSPLLALAVLCLLLMCIALGSWWRTTTLQTAAAVPHKTPLSFFPKSPGQWFPIRFYPGNPSLGDLVVTPEGVLKATHGKSLGVYGTDIAVRTRLQRPAGVKMSGLQARVRGPQGIKLNFGTRLVWFGQGPEEENAPSALKLKPREGTDSPVLLTLAVVGDNAYGWVDDRPLMPYPVVGPVTNGGISLWSMNGEFRDIECMLLDGLSEEKALEILGVK
ncbi:serine/threonine protein kinase [Prosthecobacter fusiformis]|uniref:Serine/threonine protein kinase n=1 Tax=Prosthecobacter fusiformis TaxID=48464 RepID=A0A4R7RLH7_9BACT|nr:serine/threonine-protein kinase [Prosthecobacter fusiformis]TDU66201.1 serine/threonine protein kinase [Prosthecobacter fusiformis]